MISWEKFSIFNAWKSTTLFLKIFHRSPQKNCQFLVLEKENSDFILKKFCRFPREIFQFLVLEKESTAFNSKIFCWLPQKIFQFLVFEREISTFIYKVLVSKQVSPEIYDLIVWVRKHSEYKYQKLEILSFQIHRNFSMLRNFWKILS